MRSLNSGIVSGLSRGQVLRLDVRPLLWLKPQAYAEQAACPSKCWDQMCDMVQL